MQYGDQLEWFLELEEQGEEIPALANRVELFPDLALYYKGFNELSTSRQSVMGIGYIGYLVITDYLNEEGIFGFERREYRQWITIIDRIFVQLQSDKQDRERKSKETKAPKKY